VLRSIVDCLDAYQYQSGMPRPRSDEKRTAILEAATRVIVTQGLSAPTMGIAKEAGVANGSLFTYFETKADLFNQLYLELKTEMAGAAMKGVPEGKDVRDQFFQVWRNLTNWAVAFAEKRRALAQLSVSDEITPETRAHKTMTRIRELLERCRAGGPMSKAPMSFVVMLMNSIAEGTMDFMTQDPAHANKHCKTGFEGLWRMVT
jgi:AcrR family transcriptional regulator